MECEKEKAKREDEREREAATLGPQKNAVINTQGHKKEALFFAGEALQSEASTVFFGLDYDPFGSLLPGRNYSSGSYRFGFNGKEKDDEVHGASGTSYDFGARMYDPRIGRTPSIDPKAGSFPNQSPYSAFLNNPILLVDPDGEAVKPSSATTAATFRRMLGTVLGVTPARAKEIFGLNYENRRFYREDGSSYVQAVFTVDNSERAARRFGNQIDRMLRGGDITPDQAAQAGAIYNLLAEKKTTELMLVESSQASFYKAPPLGDDMSTPPEQHPVYTIVQNGTFNDLQEQLPNPDPAVFQAGLARADGGNLSTTDAATGLPVAGGFFNESSGSPNAGALRGILVIDTRLGGSDFTSGRGGGQFTDADRDRIGAGIMKTFESGMNANGGAGGAPYERTINTGN